MILRKTKKFQCSWWEDRAGGGGHVKKQTQPINYVLSESLQSTVHM